MTDDITNIAQYLSDRGFQYKEQGNELLMHCIFSNCDEDSSSKEAHLYFNKQTGQYHCKKCDALGNIYTLGKFLGDSVGGIKKYVESSRLIYESSIKPANIAEQIWKVAAVASKDFKYLKNKKIKPYHARLHKNMLVLPIYSSEERLASLQFIGENGQKKFLKGVKSVGCFNKLGKNTEIICIAEGFATAASIHEATGYMVVIAYSAGNMGAAAEHAQKKYPESKIVICADNDATGLLKGRFAAEEVGAYLTYPEFEENEKINGKQPTDFNDLFVLHGSQAVIETIEKKKKLRSKYATISLADLLNEPDKPIKWIVDGILAAGGFSIMVAKPKVGKSTLARQLALCIAQGRPFLDRETIKGSVLYVSLEEMESEVKSHFKMLGFKGSEKIETFIGMLPEDSMEWLEDTTDKDRPDMIIIDTLFRFTRVKDVNDYSKILTALDPVLDFARSKSIHVMGLHHARKSEAEGADGTLGSTAIFGSVDTAIMLTRTKTKQTIESIQRYGKDLDETNLIFDPNTKSFELGRVKIIEDVEDIKKRIIDFLRSSEARKTREDIESNITGKTATQRTALKELVESEVVSQFGRGAKGDPYSYSCSPVPNVT